MNKPFGIRKCPEKEFLAQIENSEPPVPPDSKNTQFVNFGPKLWKFMQ